ncbi:hypothetical protein Tsubulata_019435 [Turnera subulata]|uniref:Protein POLAR LOCALIZATION DURING ASYMMETRIC DIVISION AND REDISTRIBUTION n=1 Tax=Turnera subulata TaxID=218843 RepID=A0A9Q0F837_9ROSI|nr:hypothetical protein Tsubulata_019435 [Turnera subulata]
MNPFKPPNQFHSHHRPPLRIADILLLDEEEEEEEGYGGGDSEELLVMGQVSEADSAGIGCSTPRRIAERLLSGLRRGKVKRVKEGNREKMESRGDRRAQVTCSTNGVNGGRFVGSRKETTAAAQSGQCNRRESNGNLGAGDCLLYLVAASKNELDKMEQMRTQLDTLIQDVKEVLQKKDVGIIPDCNKPPQEQKNEVFSCSIGEQVEVDRDFGGEMSHQVVESDDYPLQEDSSSVTVGDRSFKCEMGKGDESLEGMEKLVAELEVELERLEIQLDVENLSEQPEQQRIRITNDDTASSKTQSISSGEVIDPVTEPRATDSHEQCGIPPHELERKLHELLESRQQEQIRELEAALESVKRKLRDKEMEVAWWKDTAKIMAQRAKEPSQLTSRHAPNLLSP